MSVRKFYAASNHSNQYHYLFIDDSELKYETDFHNYYNDFDLIEIDYLTYLDIMAGLNAKKYGYKDLYITREFRSIY